MLDFVVGGDSQGGKAGSLCFRAAGEWLLLLMQMWTQSGRTSEPETHIPSRGQSEGWWVETLLLLPTLTVSGGLLFARALDLGCFCPAVGCSPPRHPWGHWWHYQRSISHVTTSLWSLGWRAWERRWWFLVFLLVKDWMHPVRWWVQSYVKRNKALLNSVLYTGFLIHD